MEAVFSELLNRGTSLEEVQAYVLLRQSTLSADDKKRILLENPDLKYQPVMKALRLLGSKFFHEVQTGKTNSRTKVYDTMLVDEKDNQNDAWCYVTQSAPVEDDAVSPEYLEAMISQDDQMPLLCRPSRPRSKTSCKTHWKCTRHWWRTWRHDNVFKRNVASEAFGRLANPSPRAKGKFGKTFSKGNGRQNLLAKIAKSRCRLCNQIGHWRAECPNKDRDSGRQLLHRQLQQPIWLNPP